MNAKIIIATLAAVLSVSGCGGVVDVNVDAVVDAPSVHQTYEYLQHPTISGLEYFNSETGGESHLTTSSGGYVGYTGDDTVTFMLGSIVLFTMPGDLAQPYSSLYEADAYTTASTLYSDTAVENLMAFLMTVDNDADYTNGIQIAGTVRTAAQGLRVNFNQSAYNFRADPAVQYAVAVLSGNTVYGVRGLPSTTEAISALRYL